ncbi:ribonuclease P protein component [Compostimonas suwonensis]|uniref:Ribonuclease P protein component n=1 Tax=Compostimonas suwonensis TaxID=1048394 RepID=A0A2M9C447_9MICO|nr:ribonuclease P protein component [Compostimonas suwonensis]PJJ65298.1 ribonuclease P protein component [Compostimonas suwonensis]
MLAKANRITRGDDYRVTVRRGVRSVGEHTVTYVRANSSSDQVRFGFIVAKNVGNAVVRNRVRRRLKAAASTGPCQTAKPGTDVVVRALPASVEASWATLQAEISLAVSRGSVR